MVYTIILSQTTVLWSEIEREMNATSKKSDAPVKTEKAPF